jgi:asparagine synthase (glutamine-hydrolysing)
MAGHDGWPLVAESLHNQRSRLRGDLLQRATQLDFENYLPEDILVKVDRASMLSSLEVRAPMLDVRVIEFAFGKIPSELKATPTRRKVLLKKLAARLLPSAFDRSRKQGFSIPLGAWLRAGPWRDYFEQILLDSSQTTFDHAAIRGLLDGQRRGRANSERLFGLLMFELWRREYRVASDG